MGGHDQPERTQLGKSVRNTVSQTPLSLRAQNINMPWPDCVVCAAGQRPLLPATPRVCGQNKKEMVFYEWHRRSELRPGRLYQHQRERRRTYPRSWSRKSAATMLPKQCRSHRNKLEGGSRGVSVEEAPVALIRPVVMLRSVTVSRASSCVRLAICPLKHRRRRKKTLIVKGRHLH